MPEQLYPKPKDKPERIYPNREWQVDYDLTYEWGSSAQFTKYYHSRFEAKIAAWWNVHISSWGGKAILRNRYKDWVPSK